MLKFLSKVAAILLVCLALVGGVGYAAYQYLPKAPNDGNRLRGGYSGDRRHPWAI